MEPIRTRRLVAPTATLVALLGLAAPALAAAAPVPLAPGANGEATAVPLRCPTFHWAWEPEATAYEVAVVLLGEGDDPPTPEAASPVLEQRLPAGATRWTPPLGRCLARGERYRWFVRADHEGARGAWSRGHDFEIAVSTALEAGGGTADRVDPDPAPRHREAERAAAAPSDPVRPGLGGAVPRLGAKLTTPVVFAVDGTTSTAGEYEFPHPRRVLRELPASEFRLQQPPNAGADWVTDRRGLGRLAIEFPPGEDLTAALILPLDDLPPGSEIVRLTCHFRDANPLDDLAADFELRRRHREALAAETLASLGHQSTGSSEELASISVELEAVVDPSYHYWISGTFRVGFPTPLLALYGCTLSYTEARLSPF